MFCQEYGWTGLEVRGKYLKSFVINCVKIHSQPECEKTEMSDSEPEDTEADLCLTDAGCEQECRVEAGAPVCYCSPGFEMVAGHCQDVDECREDNGGCDEECVNRGELRSPGLVLGSCLF